MDGWQHGQGTFVHSDGRTYEGAYKDSMRHGPGKYTNKQGTVFQGEFYEGKLDGVNWT